MNCELRDDKTEVVPTRRGGKANPLQPAPKCDSGVASRRVSGCGLDEQEDEVSVSVSDRGPGISDEVAARMFDPFFTTKHGESEPGMGLGIVRVS